MKYIIIITLLLASHLSGCCQKKPVKMKSDNSKSQKVCADGCDEKEAAITCKLTSPELQKRKATVIASLKKQVLERKELTNGFSYRFKGSDAVIDELNDFVKTERLCCDFFSFNLLIKGDASSVWLTISGPKGAKDFITAEMEL